MDPIKVENPGKWGTGLCNTCDRQMADGESAEMRMMNLWVMDARIDAFVRPFVQLRWL